MRSRGLAAMAVVQGCRHEVLRLSYRDSLSCLSSLVRGGTSYGTPALWERIRKVNGKTRVLGKNGRGGVPGMGCYGGFFCENRDGE